MEKKISEFLTDESMWCQYYFALDADNLQICSSSPNAVKWCIIGAAHRCKYAVTELVDFVSAANAVGISNPAYWQDEVDRTFDEVRAMLLSIGH